MTLVIHRQKFDPTGRYATVRPMVIAGISFEEGALVPHPTEDISTEVVRRLWKDRRVVQVPAKPDPVAPAAAGAGSPPGGPPRPQQAPPQARRGR